MFQSRKGGIFKNRYFFVICPQALYKPIVDVKHFSSCFSFKGELSRNANL